ncbi:Rho guanine nucleotide exchange factor scd1 [Fusarium phyllophilum]|uniref:Rho guanine nucleotide exchange factor scd1 n=1 Tax=Fusarium phyllophilum TaxID=47803 RepID=A0A8H5MMN8_9HYPO|nr:Rho guanine nucleotide exchange factor scd1 [Fusarium phyllophilum]
MDPLSVIASVAGIATAAGEVIKILGPYTTAAKDAPKVATEVSAEALAIQAIITGLEQLIINSPPLILQTFKSSIVCILSILQSDSQGGAEESQQKLIASVDNLLRGNTDPSRRMMALENTIDTMSRRRATIQSTRDTDALGRKSTSSWRSSLFEFDFEHDLKLSRVYRHAKRDTMDFSARSSVARTHAWSCLSGISLSEISNISVLALPLYVEDISNPQHYDFGQEANPPIPLLAPTILTRSIYHECIEVQLQLSQFEWFAQFQRQESPKDENPLFNLMSIFRRGTPPLMLFNELDSSHHKRWKDLIAWSPSDETSKIAITEFIQTCFLYSDIPRAYCIFDGDILLTDTTHHVKVTHIPSITQDEPKTNAKEGHQPTIVFESAPNIFAGEPNPAGLAVDAFLCDERLYLKRLESLLEDAEKMRSFRMLSLDTFDPLFAPVRSLVNVQRTFLIKVEMLVSKPYLRQTWQTAFQEWAVDSSGYYAALIPVEAELKSIVRTAVSSADIDDVGRRESSGNVLAMLGLPSQRLDEYDAFPQELT